MLRPFRGVRFTIDDLAAVTSPPYDLIDEAGVRRLLDAHPNNVVRLILPGADRHRYAEARETLRRWLSDGMLSADGTPAVYVYEQSGPGVLQRGLIGDVGLAAPELGIILPHEDVMPGPVADRLALMRTTEANLEPIFLLYDGADGTATRLVDEVASSRPPLAEATTRDGLRHRLWAIVDVGELDAIATDLRPRQALIADGHHRYATYLALQREHHAGAGGRDGAGSRAGDRDGDGAGGAARVEDGSEAGGAAKAGDGSAQSARRTPSEPGPWDFGLALLVDSRSYPPDLKAIHRVIPDLSLDEALDRAKDSWRVHEHADLTAGLTALEGTDGPAYLLSAGGRTYLLTDPDPVRLEQAMPSGRSAGWRALNTSVLAEFLLPKVWGMADDERMVRIVHHDPEAAVRLARQTDGIAVLLRPLAVDDVLAVAAQGERVPRKSTSFGPKPLTGMVLRVLTWEHDIRP
ncbi:uncharacterized protein (DUF1015 family) [Streptosporangium becharense]|uniref:Uncharacterized protein (DUF1015 family) n=1 Tax=Streptosporangium becharense TaxID=1816182 RepID=A0A7W9IC59_9ACTN|nr:DUF1015 domain-containing protein [Streptosporangium becharense]MBB2915169.1 uncharacterized protein (DUF1015 family) [Streptosporangium becharense]MBB5818002.1 uncharacterized protein (DUF1015 family) [Streptosporangium becharense]